MPLPANQITQIEIVVNGVVGAGGSNSRPAQVVYHFRRNNTVQPLSKSNISIAFQAAFVAPMLAALNARYTQQNNAIRWLNDIEDPYAFFTNSNPGAITGDSMPTDQAAFLLLRTTLRGKFARGSKHFFPFSEADTTSGTDDIFNAACLARLATLATALQTTFADANTNIWTHAVLSKKRSNFRVQPATVVTNDVAACLVNKRVGSMKHRKVKSVY